MMLPPINESDMKVLGTVGLIIIIWSIQLMAKRLVNKHVKDLKHRYTWRQTINYIALMVGLILVVRIWFAWFHSIITMLSLIAAALTMVNKEILQSLFCYPLILWRGPFKVGDRIQVGATSGDVIELSPLFITVVETGSTDCFDQNSGRVVKVPNKEIIDKHVANYSRGHNLVWNELEVVLPVFANWKKAQTMLLEMINKEAAQLSQKALEQARGSSQELMFLNTEPSVLPQVKNDKLVLTVRYLIKYYDKRLSTHRVWDWVLNTFPQHEDLHWGMAPSKQA